MSIYTPPVRFGPVRITPNLSAGRQRPRRTDRVQRIGTTRPVNRPARWALIFGAPLVVSAAVLVAVALGLLALAAVAAKRWPMYRDGLQALVATMQAVRTLHTATEA